MAWVGVIYYRKCNYYVLNNCIRHCVRGELIQNYFKIFGFLLIWDKNLGSIPVDQQQNPSGYVPANATSIYCSIIIQALLSKD